MAAHRYWRIYYTATSDGYCSAGEIQMRTVSGGSNVISGGTASASASGDGAASNAVDGNLATKWGTFASSVPQWWEYDFGAGNSKDIVEIALTSRSDGFSGETGTNFKLQYSDDNSTWVDRASWTGVSWSSSSQTQVFTAPAPPPAGVYVSKVNVYTVLIAGSVVTVGPPVGASKQIGSGIYVS